jgi:hypothetical protein
MRLRLLERIDEIQIYQYLKELNGATWLRSKKGSKSLFFSYLWKSQREADDQISGDQATGGSGDESV